MKKHQNLHLASCFLRQSIISKEFWKPIWCSSCKSNGIFQRRVNIPMTWFEWYLSISFLNDCRYDCRWHFWDIPGQQHTTCLKQNATVLCVWRRGMCQTLLIRLITWCHNLHASSTRSGLLNNILTLINKLKNKIFLLSARDRTSDYISVYKQ